MYDLNAIAEEHLVAAHADEHGRSANLILRDPPLRQSVIALTMRHLARRAQHPTRRVPPVLRGVVVTAQSGDTELTMGSLYLLPPGGTG